MKQHDGHRRPLVGCTDDSTGLDPDASAGDGSIGGPCATIPEQTAGPYPGDGSNGKNVLTQSDVARRHPVDVHATTAYATSETNYTNISFARDNMFSDGTSLQISSVTGDATSGHVASLQVGIPA